MASVLPVVGQRSLNPSPNNNKLMLLFFCFPEKEGETLLLRMSLTPVTGFGGTDLGLTWKSGHQRPALVVRGGSRAA